MSYVYMQLASTDGFAHVLPALASSFLGNELIFHQHSYKNINFRIFNIRPRFKVDVPVPDQVPIIDQYRL